MTRELSAGFNFPGYASLPNNAPEILTRNTIYLKSSEKVEPLVAAERARNFDGLVRRYIKQLLYGCQRTYCDTPTCYTARKRYSRDSNASRRFSVLSARIIACQLATQPSPYHGLCQGKPVIPVLSRLGGGPLNQSSSSFREEIAEDGEDTSNKENKQDVAARLPRGSPQEGEVEIITDKGLRDPRSFQQQLFNTKPFKMLEWIGLPPLGKLVFDFASSPTPAGEEPKWPVLNGGDKFEIPPEEPPRFQADSEAMEVIDTGLLDRDSEPVSQLKHKEIMQYPASRKRRTSSSNPTKMTHWDVTPTPHANAKSKVTTPGAWNHPMPPLQPAPPPRGHDLRKAKAMPFQTPQVTPSRSEKHSTTVQSLVSENEILPPQSLNRLDTDICTALYNMCADINTSSSQRYDAGLFARQSIFYVFSTPEALLNSFVSTGAEAHPDAFDLDLDGLDQAFRTLFQNESWETLVMQSLWTGLDVLFRTSSGEGAGMVSVKGATRAILISLHALAAAVPRGTPGEWEMVRKARQVGRASVAGYNNRIAFDDEMAQRLLRKAAEGIAFRVHVREEGEVVRMMRRHFTNCEVFQRRQRVKSAEELGQDVGAALGKERGGWGLAVCTLEWCRATFLKLWDGREAMNKLGPAGCCLSLIDLLYPGHASHGLEAEFFHTPVIADRFSPRDTPVEWNRAKPHEMVLHLISRPYLFRENVRVTYFRAINLHQMTKAYEQSMTVQRLATQMTLNTQLPSPEDDRIYQRMRIPLTNCLLVEVHRETILQDALNQIYGRELRELRRPLKVRFTNEGEEGVDHGGVQQDFFIVALREALRPEYGMFTTDEQSRMSWFSVCPLEPIHKYKLIGMLCGLAVYNGVTLPVTFPTALYMKLLRYTPKDIEHIKDGWGPLARGLRQLLDWDDGDVGDVFMRTYEFSYESYGRVKSLDMLSAKKKGIEQLEEKFNKITRTKTRSWLPPVPSIAPGDGDRWVGNLTQELDGIAGSEDSEIARRPSYRVSILEWPADAWSGEGEGEGEGEACAAQTASGADSPNAGTEDGTEVSDEDNGFGKDGNIGYQGQSTIKIAPGVEYRPAEPQKKGKQNTGPPSTTGSETSSVIYSTRPDNFETEEEAPLVTNENRKKYVKDYIVWLTDRSVRRQYEAFESGFFTIIGQRSLMLFTPATLRTLVEGIQEIDVAELEKTARYEDGYNVNHRIIKDFWIIVRGFSDEQRRMLLEFVTASSRVPANGIGSILFVIQRNGPDSDRVPTSLTCFGRLLLPEYSTRKKLKKKLELALENGKGFGVP